MQDLKEALDRIEPVTERRGDWEAVLSDAGVSARRRRRLLPAVAAVAAALFGLVLLQPWTGERTPGVLERALAAVGDGPVLHVVFRGEWGGTLVDLETGTRTPVHGEREVWFDAERRRVHEVSRLGETVEHESAYTLRAPQHELIVLARLYRRALASGTARVAGGGAVAGEAVYWITIRSELLPDVADGQKHEWAQQVAISRETYEPVATRETRDGEPGPGTFQRILQLELLPAGEGDFDAPADETVAGPFRMGDEPVGLDDAAAVLGTSPLWLGRDHEGLALAQASRRTVALGHRQETLLEGRAAEDVRECRAEVRRSGARTGAACERMREAGQPFVIRGDEIYALGPVTWDLEENALVLFYGTVGDDPGTFRRDEVRRFDRPFVALAETTSGSLGLLRGGSSRYVPPEGSLYLAAGGSGVVQVGGVLVGIEASNEGLVLSAARALVPMP